MEANPGKKNRAQNLAIAYSVQRKNKKKMAKGGELSAQHVTEGPVHSRPEMEIEGPVKCAHGGPMHCHMGCYAEGGLIEASSEKRPMPESEYNDRGSISRNRAKHALVGDDWTDNTGDASRESSYPQRKQDTDFVSERRTSIDDAYTEEDEHMLRGAKTRHADEITANTEKRANEDSNDQDGRDLDMDHKYSMADEEEDNNPSLKMSRMARGGMIDMDEDDLDEDHSASPRSLAMIVMKRRKMLAEGGQVDLERNSEEDLNNEDQMSFDAGLKEQYDLSQLDEQPEDSNEHGDDREDDEENKLDMIDAIRRKMKRGM